VLKPAAESVEYLNVGYIVSGPDHKILILNHAARQLLTTTKAISTLEEVVSFLPERLHLMDHVKYCGIEHRSCSFRQVELGDNIVRVFLSPIFENGTLSGSLLTLEDITQKVQQEKAHDQFLSFLVHELRTPLTAIRGNSTLLQEDFSDDIDDKQVREIIGYINAGSQNVLGMVNQFLDMSRLEEGRIQFELQKFSLIPLLHEVIDNLHVLAQERGLSLEVHTPHDANIEVVADPGRVRQVITNLIGNALKFTEKGGVKVSLKPGTNTVEVSVTDTGPAIPAESQANLFQKYFQASNNKLRKDSSQSTGLGLYVTKLMVEGMGGQIYLSDSEVGKGSTFTFTLDVATTSRMAHLKTQLEEAKQGAEHHEVPEHNTTDVTW